MSQRKLAVIDIETDPFEAGRLPRPFSVGFYTDEFYFDTWGDNCIHDAMTKIEKLPDEYTIFAHNGGKFDFSYFVDYIDNPIMLINARLAKARLFHHHLRDSFLIMPFPLKAYRKTEIDYSKFERHRREKFKKEIQHYQYTDCRDLFELCAAFVERFGLRLTIGGTAMRELRKIHEFERMTPESDEFFRRWYYGGRVQCFEGGLLKGPWTQFDMNSQYPRAMKGFLHPTGDAWTQTNKLPDNLDKPFFARIVADNRGALPTLVDSGLSFEQERGEFYVTNHELKTALEFDLIKIYKICEIHISNETISFDEFVDTFYSQKVECKARGDIIGELFAKFVLNSAYGKFGQNPRDYQEYYISFDDGEAIDLAADGYELVQRCDAYCIWGRAAIVRETSFFDVSIAASITSAARSMLLQGLQQADRPIYCDTDSITCRSLNATIDPMILGAWKKEMTCDYAAIAGKKLYSLFNGTPQNPITPYKKSKVVSKGGTLTCPDIISIVRGNPITFESKVPTYSWGTGLSVKSQFPKRTFTMTVDRNRKKA